MRLAGLAHAVHLPALCPGGELVDAAQATRCAMLSARRAGTARNSVLHLLTCLALLSCHAAGAAAGATCCIGVARASMGHATTATRTCAWERCGSFYSLRLRDQRVRRSLPPARESSCSGAEEPSPVCHACGGAAPQALRLLPEQLRQPPQQGAHVQPAGGVGQAPPVAVCA